MLNIGEGLVTVLATSYKVTTKTSVAGDDVMDVLPPVGNHFLVTFHVLGAGRVYVAICQVM